MKIEVLFPEIADLYGDLWNVKYLTMCVPDAEVIETSLKSEPYFAKKRPDMIYIGSMTEQNQSKAIEALMPYKDRLLDMIAEDVVIFATGTAFEIFGRYIINSDGYDLGKRVDALDILPLHARHDFSDRYNAIYYGKREEEKIRVLGFKSQFGMMYGDNTEFALFKNLRGHGINTDSTLEGVRINNFFGTYLLGPIFVLNPDFTKWILKLMGVKEPKLAFEEDVYDLHETRRQEFRDKKRGVTYEEGHH